MNKSEERLLKEAIKKLEIFSDPENERCGVDREAREKSRIYINTWVIPALKALQESLNSSGDSIEKKRAVLMANYIS